MQLRCDRCNGRKKVVRSVVCRPAADRSYAMQEELAEQTMRVGMAHFDEDVPLPEGFCVISVCVGCRQLPDHAEWMTSASERRLGSSERREDLS